MPSERLIPIDDQTRALFALKGQDGPCRVKPDHFRNGNGVKVRRIMQMVRDIARKPFDQLRILDLACGEGVYAIEAALRGARVRALDARAIRMSQGAEAARRLGLDNCLFVQEDVRNLRRDTHGDADVVLFLGLLYHLHQKDLFSVLRNVFDICNHCVVIDTHIALRSQTQIEYGEKIYYGRHHREHADHDPPNVRESRVMASLDNATSFWFTKESLFRLLQEIGFTSVLQCDVPFEPLKPEDRITILAVKGEPVTISSYPWVNGETDEAIERMLIQSREEASPPQKGINRLWSSLRFVSWVNGFLGWFGLRLTRL